MKKLEQLKNKGKMLIAKIPFINYIQKKWGSQKSIKESLKYFHDTSDPKEIERTTPPKSEKIEFHCAWVTEIFTPSNVDILIKSLKKLGWDNPENNIGINISLTDWIKQSRSYGSQDSWINGGIIVSKNDKSRFIGADVRRTELPLGVDYCYFSLRNITSSITLVTMQFIFNDEIANSINEPFNVSYKTKIQRISSSLLSFIGPIEQKRQEVKKRLKIIHASLYSWFNKNLAGNYSLAQKELPTIDLITSTEYKQLKAGEKRLRDYYIDLLFDYSFETWLSKDAPSLELRLSMDSNENPMATLFGKLDDLTYGTEQYGGKNKAGLTYKFNTIFSKTIGLLAIHNLLLSYQKQLSAIRDKAVLPIKRVKHALENLNYIRFQFLSISTDIQVISQDIEKLVNSKIIYSSDCMDFTPPEYYKNKYPDFLELLRQQTEMRSGTLIKLETKVNESVNASGNLTTAIANLRIQRNVFWLTIVIILLTILSIFYSVLVSQKHNHNYDKEGRTIRTAIGQTNPN